jgi:hypothetical protein
LTIHRAITWRNASRPSGLRRNPLDLHMSPIRTSVSSQEIIAGSR